MGLFNKVLASIGIGAAQVDTILKTERLQAGSQVKGVIKIKGGKVEQQIDRLYLFVMTKYEKEVDDTKKMVKEKIQQVELPIETKVGPGAQEEHEFSFILDKQTPISSRKSPVWITTGLDIKQAIDPKDKDNLQITPHPYLQQVINALNELGFRQKKIKNEYSHWGQRPFVQELEFRPTGKFKADLDELELVYFIKQNEIELILEVDKQAQGLGGLLAEAADLDETKLQLKLSEGKLNQEYLVEELEQKIQNYS